MPSTTGNNGTDIIRAEGLTRYYKVKGKRFFQRAATLKALDGVSFAIRHGQTLAVVGESGCGKSTLARLVTMIEAPTSGTFTINDIDGTTRNQNARKQLRKSVQIVFQDPYGSLSPRLSIGQIIEEGLVVHNMEPDRSRRRNREDWSTDWPQPPHGSVPAFARRR